jgi:hypothetical protein
MTKRHLSSNHMKEGSHMSNLTINQQQTGAALAEQNTVLPPQSPQPPTGNGPGPGPRYIPPIYNSSGNYSQPPAPYQPPTLPGYNNGYQSYYSPVQHSLSPGQIAFWIFYALVGFWVDLALSLTFWMLAIILPFTYPFIWAVGGREGLITNPNIVLVPGDLFYGQSDSTIYNQAALISLLGVVLLVVAILTLKPWFKTHLAMFRRLGGLHF